MLMNAAMPVDTVTRPRVSTTSLNAAQLVGRKPHLTLAMVDEQNLDSNPF